MRQLDGRYRVIDWKAPEDTVMVDGMEYKWIGIKKEPDLLEYLRAQLNKENKETH